MVVIITIRKKLKWIAISEKNHELLKNQGKFLESFDDVIAKLLFLNKKND